MQQALSPLLRPLKCLTLNEAFDLDTQNAYKTVLAVEGPYKHYVKFIGDADEVTEDDSGIAIYSKFPFETLPNQDDACTGADKYELIGTNATVPDTGQYAAFFEFDEKIGGCPGFGDTFEKYSTGTVVDLLFGNTWSDCIADKGAAFVRIRHPSGRIFNVAISHMMASYLDDDDQEVFLRKTQRREAELNVIKQLIECQVGPLNEMSTQDVLVLGDLNIQGDLSYDDTSAAGGFNSLHEWASRFQTPTSFFRNTLHDVWAYEAAPFTTGLREADVTPTAPTDIGWTNVFDSVPARLDYLLRNRTAEERAGTGGLCVQHMTIGYNLHNGLPQYERGLTSFTNADGVWKPSLAGPHFLSDHFALNADINRLAPQCSPVPPIGHDVASGYGARELVGSQIYAGTITHPGSMQWFRIPEGGTYSIAPLATNDIEAPEVFVRVYDADDISTPVNGFGRRTVHYPRRSRPGDSGEIGPGLPGPGPGIATAVATKF